MSADVSICQYADEKCYCTNEATESGWCFWHDRQLDKNLPDIRKRLEKYAKKGGLLRGICLKRANLHGVDLVKHKSKTGYDLSYADFYRADLSNAHLFNTNFSNASLMKANLEHANLHCANLQNCNMLGIRLHGSRIENVRFGKFILQEQQAIAAQRAGEREKSLDLFEQAEEIYRDLRKHAEREGVFTMSGIFIRKELTMRRYQFDKFSFDRFTSKVTDVFCGYGEVPLRVVGISICLILLCASLYFFTGINYNGEVLVYQSGNSFSDNIGLFLTCLYYSVVTFTTLGYGDYTPFGLSKLVAAIQAFTGSFTIALFVVVFVKKMTR